MRTLQFSAKLNAWTPDLNATMAAQDSQVIQNLMMTHGMTHQGKLYLNEPQNLVVVDSIPHDAMAVCDEDGIVVPPRQEYHTGSAVETLQQHLCNPSQAYRGVCRVMVISLPHSLKGKSICVRMWMNNLIFIHVLFYRRQHRQWCRSCVHKSWLPSERLA